MNEWQYAILWVAKSDASYVVAFYDDTDRTPRLKRIRCEQGMTGAFDDLLRDGWQYVDHQPDQPHQGYHLQFRRPRHNN